jgi:hypothetical protein
MAEAEDDNNATSTKRSSSRESFVPSSNPGDAEQYRLDAEREDQLLNDPGFLQRLINASRPHGSDHSEIVSNESTRGPFADANSHGSDHTGTVLDRSAQELASDDIADLFVPPVGNSCQQSLRQSKRPPTQYYVETHREG